MPPLTQPFNKIHTLLSPIPIPWDAERVTAERPHLPKATHLKRHQKTLLRQDPKLGATEGELKPQRHNGTVKHTQPVKQQGPMKVAPGIWEQAEQGKHHLHPFQYPQAMSFRLKQASKQRKDHVISDSHFPKDFPTNKTVCSPGFALITGEGCEGGETMLADSSSTPCL